MKIGVFGDSFCNKVRLNSPTPVVWYNFLQADYGHDIDCFGEPGSSILFSAKLIEQHAANYDLVIWCLTTPGRFSFPDPSKDISYHITTAWTECTTNDFDLAKKHEVCIDYLKYVFDWDTENFVGQAIVTYLQSKFSNIMIIPCFPPPLGATFNLYEVSQRETNFYFPPAKVYKNPILNAISSPGVYFPGKQLHTAYTDYHDGRVCHLTLENQTILGRLVNENLKPGVFQTSYDHFVDPTTPFDQAFIPR